MALRWWRGPGQVRGDFLLLEVAAGSEYSPLDGDGPLGVAERLQRVRTVEDVVAFVAMFGPLTVWTPDDAGEYSEAARGRGPQVHQLPAASISSTIHHAGAVRAWLQVAEKIRRAHAGSDKPSAAKLRRELRGIAPALALRVPETRGGRDHDFLYTLSADIAARVTSRLIENAVEPRVFAASPGRFDIGVRPSTLLGVAYLGVARLLTKQSLKMCPVCDDVFAQGDSRQEYCSPRCGDRKRQQDRRARLKERRQGA
jgi:hypothetical protein